MLKQDSFAEVSMDTYKTWLDAFDPALRNKILADWGPVEQEKLMTYQFENHRAFIIPRLEYGNNQIPNINPNEMVCGLPWKMLGVYVVRFMPWCTWAPTAPWSGSMARTRG